MKFLEVFKGKQEVIELEINFWGMILELKIS
jgi:hypothetical protein